MTSMTRELSYGPVIFLTTMALWIYSVAMVAFISQMVHTADEGLEDLSWYKGNEVVNVVFLNILFGMVTLCFFRASGTLPGDVPSIYPWDPSLPPMSAEAVEFERIMAQKGLRNVRGLERKMDGRARFCRVCNRYKPDRAHHSSKFGECVLEMDHYCPWIRNVVGFRNKKFFLLLIFYGLAALLFVCISLGPSFVFYCEQMAGPFDFVLVFTWLLACLLVTALVPFAMMHCWLMVNAFTTIELCEKRRAGASKRNVQGIPVSMLYKSSPYDMGWYHNVTHLLGPWYLWFIPTRAKMPTGIFAGCVFDVNPEHPLYKSTIEGASVGATTTGTEATTTHDVTGEFGTDEDDDGTFNADSVADKLLAEHALTSS